MKEIGNEYHVPVLYQEALDALIWNPDGVYIDCTLGGGSHSEGILKRLSEKGRLISMDQDQNAISFCKKRLENYADKWSVFQNNFENIDIVAYLGGADKVDGILMDIGVSSTQLDDAERGFSYRYDSRLDMRMDPTQSLSAYELVNTYTEKELIRIFFEYGEERHAKRIASLICEARKQKAIETTGELVKLIKRAYPERAAKHPAKKTFQAIRMEVNRELEVLATAIKKSVGLLNPKGRLAIITFHSLEDRLVKTLFRDLSTACKCPSELPICVCDGKASVKILTKKPIIPSLEELEQNNRAHSSKLRVIERLA